MSGHTKRERRHRWPGLIATVIILVIFGVGFVAVISGRFQLHPVLSGSMRPGFPVGSVVAAERVPVTSLRERDVIVFHPPDNPQELVVHRIVSLTAGPAGPIIRTQGDANNTRDDWTITLKGAWAYRVSFAVPLLGYPATWIHGPMGMRILTVAGILLIAGAAISGVRARRRPANRPARHLRDSKFATINASTESESALPGDDKHPDTAVSMADGDLTTAVPHRG